MYEIHMERYVARVRRRGGYSAATPFFPSLSLSSASPIHYSLSKYSPRQVEEEWGDDVIIHAITNALIEFQCLFFRSEGGQPIRDSYNVYSPRLSSSDLDGNEADISVLK